MTWIEDFWAANSNAILPGVVTVVLAAIVCAFLKGFWQIVTPVVRAVVGFVYWLLIGWWIALIRRWITGSTW